MNNKLNKNLYIFNKNVNNNGRLIPLKINKNNLGAVKYLPAISKEWKNTVYTFNKNNTMNLPIQNISINSLIKDYFNVRFLPEFISVKNKPRWIRRPSMNKIYVSDAEVKHTNSKAIITIYSYNRERIALLNKIKSLRKGLLQKIRNFLFENINLKGESFVKEKIQKDFFFKEELEILRRFKLRLGLNKYKFEEKLLYKLSNIIGLYYNKKVEFNIVNLKSLILNSDIFTKMLADKLWKKKIRTLKMMDAILNKALLPQGDRILEKGSSFKSVNFDLIENKYKNLHLTSALKKDNLDVLLKELYNNILLEDNNDKDVIKMHDILFNSIKYKNVSGVRLEVKGRLTKRNKAERAIFKLKWKGGLKDVYSSYKGLSTVKLRGQISSNLEYSMVTSKRRVGAFAVKGWVGGK